MRRKKGGRLVLVCLATGADPVIRERLGIVVAAAPRPLYGAMDGAHKGWMDGTHNERCFLFNIEGIHGRDTHKRGYPLKRIPNKEDTLNQPRYGFMDSAHKGFHP